MSNSTIPAKNYAIPHSGVSYTEVREDIVDECLVARIIIGVSDGVNLPNDIKKSMQESKINQR